jgi:hypothetical protein
VRCIIAGSRDITNRCYLDAALQACRWTREITSVVCGGATGIDALGDRWALQMGLPVRYYIVTNEGTCDYSRLVNLRRPGLEDKKFLFTGDFPSGTFANVEIVADWTHDGPKAGPLRNAAMARDADALIAVPLAGRRKGTDSMIREATARDLRIFVREVSQ